MRLGKWLGPVGILLGIASPAQALSFDQRIESSLPPARLWSYLKAALAGSPADPLWPQRYSTVAGEVREGGIIQETVFGTTRLRYVISDFREGQGFTYAPLPEEPLRGRSSIEVKPRDPGSLLLWRGEYEVAPWSPRGVSLRFYETLFFRALRQNIRSLEAAESAR